MVKETDMGSCIVQTQQKDHFSTNANGKMEIQQKEGSQQLQKKINGKSLKEISIISMNYKGQERPTMKKV